MVQGERRATGLDHAIAGRVEAIFTAESAGEPTRSHESVELIPGVGIAGDRYATKRGHWSDPRWPDQELTLIEAERAEALGIEPGLLRRNIITRGLRVADLIGRRFSLGEAVIGGVRPCDPCRYLEGLVGRPGLKEALGDGGLRAHVVKGGWIRVGDGICLLEDRAVEGEGQGEA